MHKQQISWTFLIMEEFYSLERKEMLCAKFCSFRSLELSRAEVWIEGIDRELRLEYSTEKRKRWKRPAFLVISVIMHCYRQKYGAIQSTSGQTMVVWGSNQFQNHCISCFVPREVIWKVESEMIRGGRLGPPDWSLFVRKQFKSIDCFSPPLTYIL